jgi:sRNA-binding regulator protein Hfq
MSEIIKEKLKIDSSIIIYQTNGFRYAGKVISVDDDFVLILDYKTNSQKFINLKDISNIDVQERLG